MDTPLAPPRALDLEESVAGEEDPGASVDVTVNEMKPEPKPDKSQRDDAPSDPAAPSEG